MIQQSHSNPYADYAESSCYSALANSCFFLQLIMFQILSHKALKLSLHHHMISTLLHSMQLTNSYPPAKRCIGQAILFLDHADGELTFAFIEYLPAIVARVEVLRALMLIVFFNPFLTCV